MGPDHPESPATSSTWAPPSGSVGQTGNTPRGKPKPDEAKLTGPLEHQSLKDKLQEIPGAWRRKSGARAKEDMSPLVLNDTS